MAQKQSCLSTAERPNTVTMGQKKKDNWSGSNWNGQWYGGGNNYRRRNQGSGESRIAKALTDGAASAVENTVAVTMSKGLSHLATRLWHGDDKKNKKKRKRESSSSTSSSSSSETSTNHGKKKNKKKKKKKSSDKKASKKNLPAKRRRNPKVTVIALSKKEGEYLKDFNKRLMTMLQGNQQKASNLATATQPTEKAKDEENAKIAELQKQNKEMMDKLVNLIKTVPPVPTQPTNQGCMMDEKTMQNLFKKWQSQAKPRSEDVSTREQKKDALPDGMKEMTLASHREFMAWLGGPCVELQHLRSGAEKMEVSKYFKSINDKTDRAQGLDAAQAKGTKREGTKQEVMQGLLARWLDAELGTAGA